MLQEVVAAAAAAALQANLGIFVCASAYRMGHTDIKIFGIVLGVLLAEGADSCGVGRTSEMDRLMLPLKLFYI